MVGDTADTMSVTRPLSPDNQGGSERKRRRKVLSCYDCRRRKLQCDRAMPACGRCTKAGQASNCLYLDDANETPTHDPDTGDRLIADRGPLGGYITRPLATAAPTGQVLGRLEFQDKRIRELESALSQQNAASVQRLRSSKFPLTPESLAGGEQISSAIQDRESMLLRGRSFKTQFNGATHTASVIAYLPELNSYTKEAFAKFPALSRIRQNMKQLEDRTMYAGVEKKLATDEVLRGLLPSKQEADELVQLYLQYFDSIYHVIHVPTFRKQYDELWKDVPNASPHFIAVLLLIMACARCLMPNQPWLYTANSSTARERAVTAIEACGDWIGRQSQKHVTIEDFQIRFLLVVGKVINARKFKRSWTEAGECLRFFMCAGLHRNPEFLRKQTSSLDKDMRRRLWTASTEFELQTSFDRGMLSMPWAMQSDSPPPINVHDEDFDVHSDSSGAPHPASEFTKSSYLALASETLLLRHQMNTLLNDIRQAISFEEAKRLTEEVEAHLSSLPEWSENGSEAPQALLSINLRQYLLALHDRVIRQGISSFERNFSRTVLVETAAKMVESHRAVVSKGNYALTLLCQDFLRAALSVCHVFTTLDPAADRILYRVIEENTLQVIEEANELICDKVVRFGREQRQQWIALAVLGFVKSKREPEKRMVYMQEVVDRITRPYYRILASQENASLALPEMKDLTRNDDMPNGMIEYLPDVSGQAQLNDPSLLNLDEIAAWTFDDFALNPADFENIVDPYQTFV